MSEEMPATVEALRDKVRELEESLEQIRERHREQLDRMSENHRVQQLRQRIENTQRQALERLTSDYADKLANTVDPATTNDPFYRNTLHRAFTIARLLGYRAEALQLADRLDESELYRETGADLSEPENDRERYEAIAQIADRQIWSEAGRHAREPQYRALWEQVFRHSKQMGLCGEYERVASFLGVPTDFEVNWSGTVRVDLSATVYVEASGQGDAETPDPWDYAHDFSTSDIEWEVESAEWSEWEIEE